MVLVPCCSNASFESKEIIFFLGRQEGSLVFVLVFSRDTSPRWWVYWYTCNRVILLVQIWFNYGLYIITLLKPHFYTSAKCAFRTRLASSSRLPRRASLELLKQQWPGAVGTWCRSVMASLLDPWDACPRLQDMMKTIGSFNDGLGLASKSWHIIIQLLICCPCKIELWICEPVSLDRFKRATPTPNARPMECRWGFRVHKSMILILPPIPMKYAGCVLMVIYWLTLS